MLAIGVHRQRMREAGRARARCSPCSTAAPLPRLLGSTITRSAGVGGGQSPQPVGGAVGAAVDDDPHRLPLRARAAHRLVDLAPVL